MSESINWEMVSAIGGAMTAVTAIAATFVLHGIQARAQAAQAAAQAAAEKAERDAKKQTRLAEKRAEARGQLRDGLARLFSGDDHPIGHEARAISLGLRQEWLEFSCDEVLNALVMAFMMRSGDRSQALLVHALNHSVQARYSPEDWETAVRRQVDEICGALLTYRAKREGRDETSRTGLRRVVRLADMLDCHGLDKSEKLSEATAALSS